MQKFVNGCPKSVALLAVTILTLKHFQFSTLAKIGDDIL